MASGTINGTTNNQYISVRIDWNAVADMVLNQSTVTASFYARKTSSSSAPTSGNGVWYLSIDGQQTTFARSVTVNNDNSWVLIGTATKTVAHNADGTRTIQIVGSGGTRSTTWTSTSCSATVALDAIPRGTIPTFDSATKNIGDTLEITLNRADPSFYHSISYSWQGVTTLIFNNVQASLSWAIPMSLISTLPNSASGTAYILVTTYNANGVSLGTTSAPITCNVPSSIVPEITSISATDSGSVVPASWGVFVRGKSVLHVAVNAQGVYGSTVISYTIEALGQTRTANDIDIGTITSSGSVSVSVSVTDSRGRTAQSSISITVEDHADPVIEIFTVKRANNTGALVDNGTYSRTTVKCSGSSVDSKNTITAKIYHMRSDLTDWTLAQTIDVAYSADTYYMIPNMIPSRSYAFKIEVSDQFGTSLAEATLPAEGAVIGWIAGGSGISFGKAAEEEFKADFGWEIHARQGATIENGLNADELHLDAALAVTEGGTGGTTPETARSGIGAADAEHAHALTSAKITGVLPVSKLAPDPASAAAIVTALKASLVDTLYPIGAIYISTVATSPETLFGGSWSRIEGRFLLAADSTYVAGSEGGVATHNHVSPVGYDGTIFGFVNYNGTAAGGNGKLYRSQTAQHTGSSLASNINLGRTGNANNLPPYLAVYVWERNA